MANTQNLFEKYGIKEVADVTFYRIEKKEQTFESQRTITAASVLKGALELRKVYPVNDEGVGEEDGFDAYVFVDADVIDGTNYDCDDNETVRAKLLANYDEAQDCFSAAHTQQSVEQIYADNMTLIVEAGLNGEVPMKKLTGSEPVVTDTDEFVGVTIIKKVTVGSTTTETPMTLDGTEDLATLIGTSGTELYAPIGITTPAFIYKRDKESGVPVSTEVILANLAETNPVTGNASVECTSYEGHVTKAKATIFAEIKLEFDEDLNTGAYNNPDATAPDPS